MPVSQPVQDDTCLVASPEPVEITDTTPTAGTRHHPRWCDRQHCITGDDGTRHSSTPTRLTTGEQIFALTLIQHDPHCDPELLIEVTDTADPDGLHVLAVPEIKALAETLLIEYLKAAALIPAARNPGTTTVEVTGARPVP
ncbi:MAG: hypothetical protein ACRDR6_28450 [Pseudonocardiaceae bacterium]